MNRKSQLITEFPYRFALLKRKKVRDFQKYGNPQVNLDKKKFDFELQNPKLLVKIPPKKERTLILVTNLHYP